MHTKPTLNLSNGLLAITITDYRITLVSFHGLLTTDAAVVRYIHLHNNHGMLTLSRLAVRASYHYALLQIYGQGRHTGYTARAAHGNCFVLTKKLFMRLYKGLDDFLWNN